jgi:hypothetical protein
LVGSLAHCVATRDFCCALAALVSPVQNICCLTIRYFNLCVPIAQQDGQAVVQGCLSLNVCPVRKLPVNITGACALPPKPGGGGEDGGLLENTLLKGARAIKRGGSKID